MGDPQPAYGASRYLEVLLRERFPGKKFEVINLGITAINSHVILPIARECARHDGDFWIVYMGNNEMVGPFGAATVFGAQALPRRAAQINLALQRTRIGQLLVAGLRQLGGKSKNTSWGGMEMFLENRIAPGDPRKETVYRNFEGNLRDIVQAGVDSGAKVILNTVSVNLKDCPPFASLTNSNLPASGPRSTSTSFLPRGNRCRRKAIFRPPPDRSRRRPKLDPQFAEAHFRLAQCELALTNADARGSNFKSRAIRTRCRSAPTRGSTPPSGRWRSSAPATGWFCVTRSKPWRRPARRASPAMRLFTNMSISILTAITGWEKSGRNKSGGCCPRRGVRPPPRTGHRRKPATARWA